MLQGDVGLFEPNRESILLRCLNNESFYETIMLCVLNSSQDPAVAHVHECLSFEMKIVTFIEPKKVTVFACKRDICEFNSNIAILGSFSSVLTGRQYTDEWLSNADNSPTSMT